MIESKCPFNQPLRSEAFGCVHARAITRRDGPDVCCTSQPAQERCSAVFELMKTSALPDFGVADDPQQMPYSVVVKIQFGGLLGLQRHLGVGSPDPHRVENIDALVQRAVAVHGSPAEIPYGDLIGDISAHKIKRRRAR